MTYLFLTLAGTRPTRSAAPELWNARRRSLEALSRCAAAAVVRPSAVGSAPDVERALSLAALHAVSETGLPLLLEETAAPNA